MKYISYSKLSCRHICRRAPCPAPNDRHSVVLAALRTSTRAQSPLPHSGARGASKSLPPFGKRPLCCLPCETSCPFRCPPYVLWVFLPLSLRSRAAMRVPTLRDTLPPSAVPRRAALCPPCGPSDPFALAAPCFVARGGLSCPPRCAFCATLCPPCGSPCCPLLLHGLPLLPTLHCRSNLSHQRVLRTPVQAPSPPSPAPYLLFSAQGACALSTRPCPQLPNLSAISVLQWY